MLITTGAEAIRELGGILYKNFSIDNEPYYSIYKQVYENFYKRLTEEGTKGILLIGKIGVGKTALMRIMQKIFMSTKSGFKLVGANEFKYLIEDYSVNQLMFMYGKQSNIDLYIDDIGIASSPDYKKFGNPINMISDIIYERYELFLQKGFRTHVSSNLPKQVDKEKYPNLPSLYELYGERITDRLNEICETIALKGETLRK